MDIEWFLSLSFQCQYNKTFLCASEEKKLFLGNSVLIQHIPISISKVKQQGNLSLLIVKIISRSIFAYGHFEYIVMGRKVSLHNSPLFLIIQLNDAVGWHFSVSHLADKCFFNWCLLSVIVAILLMCKVPIAVFQNVRQKVALPFLCKNCSVP